MDERTQEEKLRDAALNTERRTIGHRMSRKVLVVAPTHLEAQQWAHAHGITYSDTVFVGPHNFSTAARGCSGVEHVIVGWARFDPTIRAQIKEILAATRSAPFEDEGGSDVADAAADLRV